MYNGYPSQAAFHQAMRDEWEARRVAHIAAQLADPAPAEEEAR